MAGELPEHEMASKAEKDKPVMVPVLPLGSITNLPPKSRPIQAGAGGATQASKDAERVHNSALVSATAGTDLSELNRPAVKAEIVPHPLIDGMIPEYLHQGVLIPLKTTLELRQDHTIIEAYITRAPTKAANSIVNLIRNTLPEGKANSLPHLRRCAKPVDMPAHLKTQFMNDNPSGRAVHTGRSNWIYILLGETKDIDPSEMAEQIAQCDGMAGQEVFMSTIAIPLVPPTSQVQAALWTGQFWPTVYRKNNPLGPHPSIVARATEEICSDASVWMGLAYRAARRSAELGLGEPMAAVIVQREGTRVELVALAADARWCHEPDRVGTGNAMAHCVLRAISMVAQKLVRHEGRQNGRETAKAGLFYDALQDSPILEEERAAFELEHPNPDGYLCHGLEMYSTHEPCVECSMAILHSRMGKVVFGERMTLTGGMASEDRGHGHEGLEAEDCEGGGRGLGLFWRRELNWSLLSWEWERGESFKALPRLDPRIHA